MRQVSMWAVLCVLVGCTEIAPLDASKWGPLTSETHEGDGGNGGSDVAVADGSDSEDAVADDAVDTAVEDISDSFVPDGEETLPEVGSDVEVADQDADALVDDVPDVPDMEDLDTDTSTDDLEVADDSADVLDEDMAPDAEDVSDLPNVADADVNEDAPELTTPDTADDVPDALEDVPVIDDAGEEVAPDTEDVPDTTGDEDADAGSASDTGTDLGPDIPPVPCDGIVCPDDGNPCTLDLCEANLCIHPSADGVACDDGDLCTTDDTCMDKVCVPGEPTVCDDGIDCTQDSCSPASGQCIHDSDDGLCNDGNECSSESCVVEKQGCVYTLLPACCTKAAQCDDHNVCTVDVCESETKTCLNVPTTGACSDGDACTDGDFCKEGLCVAGTPKSCTDDNPCTDDACDAVTGACVFVNNSASCSDGDACTVGDVCTEGSCMSGAPKVCDDGDACTQNETCENGVCTSGTPVSCDDEDPCTKDSCDSATGCSNTPYTPPDWVQNWKKGTYESWFQPDSSWNIGACGGSGCDNGTKVVLGTKYSAVGNTHSITFLNPTANVLNWPLQVTFAVKGFYGNNVGAALTVLRATQAGFADPFPEQSVEGLSEVLVSFSFTPASGAPVVFTVKEGGPVTHNGSWDYSIFSETVEMHYICTP